MQFKFFNLEFKPTLFGFLVTIICIPLFIKLGFWQYNKAMLKQSIQNEYNQSASRGVLDLASYLDKAEELQYQKVSVTGSYDPKYQILIDNQVENDLAGFHVLTPLKIEHSDQFVLVNRGWIKGNDLHNEIPNVSTPLESQVVQGMVWIPSKKIFTLEDKTNNNLPNKSWQLVWQNLDMAKYQKLAPLKLLPVIIKLDPESKAGGFVRNWQAPVDRIMTNLGYAYQWFGFAISTFAIFMYMSLSRLERK